MLHVSVKRHFEKEYCAASCQVTQKKESDLFEDVCWALVASHGEPQQPDLLSVGVKVLVVVLPNLGTQSEHRDLVFSPVGNLCYLIL
jgi:hypothetical protein